MNIKKWIAFGCTHCPLQDDAAINWLIKNIQEYKPDYVIHLGDLFEAASASRWDNEENFTLEDEFFSANEMLFNIRKHSGKAKCVFVPGNHDYNILAINRIDKRLRGLCDWRKEQNMPELKNWEVPCEYTYDRNRGVFRLGQVTFAHGYEASTSSNEMQSILLSNPYSLFCSAHTHKGVPVTQAQRTKAVKLPYWYTNVGCMRNLDPEWCNRKRTFEWTQGLVKGDTLVDSGSLSCRARYSTAWNAESLIFKTKSEYTKK